MTHTLTTLDFDKVMQARGWVLVIQVNPVTVGNSMQTAIASQDVLAKEWLNKAEDEAWKDL